MVKVLYLDHGPVLGGAERVLLDLIGSLDRRRYQPVVATASASSLLPFLVTEDVQVATMPFEQVNPRHPTFPLRLARSTLALVGIIRRHRPDVLHSNTVRAHIVSSLAALLTRVPLVWTMHDTTFPSPLVRLLGPIPRRVIFVSRFLADLYRPAGLDPRRCQVISNGVRPVPPVDKEAARRNLSLDPQCPVVVNVGRLIEGKGQDVFLQAAALIAQRRPDAVFLVVGGSNSADQASAGYAQRLSELSSLPGLEGKAILTGHQPEPAPYYAAADVCTYTATVPEGLPMVLLEAMAWGKAVVASDVGAVSEVVRDGVTGRLVPPGAAGDLAGTVLALLDDQEALRQLGMAGRQRVVEEFDQGESLRRLQAVYEGVVAEVRLGGRKRVQRGENRS